MPRTIRNIIHSKEPQLPKNLSVIILASRFRLRMKLHGICCNYKSYDGVFLLDHQVKTIRSVYPNADIVVVTGYETDKIAKRRNGFRIVENQLYGDTNEVEDVRLGLNNVIYDNVLVINGDVWFNSAAITTPIFSSVVFDSLNQLKNYDVGLTIFEEKATILAFNLNRVWANLTLFCSNELRLLQSLCTRINGRKFLFEIINDIIDKGGVFKAIQPPGMKIMKIDSNDNLEYFKNKPIFHEL